MSRDGPSGPGEGAIDRETFRSRAAGERPVVVHAPFPLDVETTPLSAYAALAGGADAGADGDSEGMQEGEGNGEGDDHPAADEEGDGRQSVDGSAGRYAFLLESAEKVAASDPDGAFRPGGSDPERHARYSFVGWDPAGVVTVCPDGVDVEVLGPAGGAGAGADAAGDLLAEAAHQVAGGDGGPGDDGEPVAGHDEGDRPGGRDDGDAGDTLDHLRAAMPDVQLAGFGAADRPQLRGGFVGFLAYEAAYDCWLGEVGVERPDSGFPDAQFLLATRLLAVDHHAGTVTLVRTPVLREGDDADAVFDALLAEREQVQSALAGATAPSPGRAQFVSEAADGGADRAAYESAVRAAKEHVAAGDVYQCVLSRRRERYGAVDPVDLYAALRRANPSPYMYLLAHDDRAIVGASPETLVSVAGDRVVANPIAGTCPRGDGPVDDRRLAGELLADAKERAEHTMLVDLARNDVRRVSEPGSVRVEEFMAVLKYAHVQHIESTVVGRLAGDADAFDAIRATFPAGTLAGAPKVRAMELVDELEPHARGPYGGGVGYVSWSGDADVAITIRTAVVEAMADADPPPAVAEAGLADAEDLRRVTLQAGAGIVADSRPAAEFEETGRKLAGLVDAIDSLEDPDRHRDAGDGRRDSDDRDGGTGVVHRDADGVDGAADAEDSDLDAEDGGADGDDGQLEADAEVGR